MTQQPSPPPLQKATLQIPPSPSKEKKYFWLAFVFVIAGLATFFIPVVGFAFAVAALVFTLKLKKEHDKSSKVVAVVFLVGFSSILLVVGIMASILFALLYLPMLVYIF